MRIDLDGAAAIFVFPARPSDADIEIFLQKNIELLERNTAHATIVDMSEVVQANPNQRKMAAAFVRENRAALQRLRICTAFVVPSPLNRGIVTAVMWLQRPPYKFTLVPTLRDAQAWVTATVQRASATPLSASAGPR